mmetsp:Transcript_29135/g.95039  ORF Transcript_29135/g.95039 Transcript_29135/m.95039 type:complete len:247 (-) Transcript_29135:463-1203(-)
MPRVPDASVAKQRDARSASQGPVDLGLVVQQRGPHMSGLNLDGNQIVLKRLGATGVDVPECAMAQLATHSVLGRNNGACHAGTVEVAAAATSLVVTCAATCWSSGRTARPVDDSDAYCRGLHRRGGSIGGHSRSGGATVAGASGCRLLIAPASELASFRRAVEPSATRCDAIATVRRRSARGNSGGARLRSRRGRGRGDCARVGASRAGRVDAVPWSGATGAAASCSVRLGGATSTARHRRGGTAA